MAAIDVETVADVPLFSALETAEIRDILEQAASRRLDASVSVFEEGEDAERFFLLVEGYIRAVRMSPEGEQVILLHIPPCQPFGMTKAIGRETYPATAITATSSTILSWPMRLWSEFASQYDGFAIETYKTLGQHIAEMSTRMVEMATQKVEQRVANTLLRLVEQTGRVVDMGIEIDFPITRQEISEMTGTTLYTVSRLLSSWEKQKLVKSGRKRIVVRDPDELLLLGRKQRQTH